MRVKILRVEDLVEVKGTILKSNLFKGDLPSITDKWRFNFKKYGHKAGNQTFILVTEECINKIEGCLIFKMKAKVEP
jgi:hypothetical protein